ncbi:hypothetical protein [Flavobacterium sp. U410]
MIKNIVLFSKFYFLVGITFFKILFSGSKRLKREKVNYASYPYFKDSFLLFEFHFKNALYFKINNVKHLHQGTKIIPLKNYNYTIDFYAIGIFETYHQTISIEPGFEADFSDFKTKTSKLQLQSNEQKKLHINIEPTVRRKIAKLYFDEIRLKHKKATIKFNTYNQNEFI